MDLENLDVIDFLRTVFANKRENQFTMIVINFTLGIVLGPTSTGLIYYVTFMLIYLAFVIYLTRNYSDTWDPVFILAFICTGLFGFIIGRCVVSQWLIDPLEPGDIVVLQNKLESQGKVL